MSYGGAIGRVRYTDELLWWVDPAGTNGGSDSNSGLAAGAPLRTLAEWRRRACLGGHVWYPPGFGILTVLSDCSESMALTLAGDADGRDGTIRGARTLGATGTVSASATQDAAAKRFASITDQGGRSWAGDVGKRLWIQGTGDEWTPGLIADVLADAGGGQAITTPWIDELAGTRNVSPAAGDTWQLLDYPHLSGQWAISTQGPGHYVTEMTIGGNAGSAGIYLVGTDNLQAHGVRILADGYTLEAKGAGSLYTYGAFSLGGHIRSTDGGRLFVHCGGIHAASQRLYGPESTVKILAPLTLSGGAYLATDSTDMHVNAEVGIRTIGSGIPIRHGRGAIWLQDKVFVTGCTATLGLQVEAGQQVLCRSSAQLPTFDTPTNYASLGGTTKTRAELASSFISTNGAALVQKVF